MSILRKLLFVFLLLGLVLTTPDLITARTIGADPTPVPTPRPRRSGGGSSGGGGGGFQAPDDSNYKANGRSCSKNSECISNYCDGTCKDKPKTTTPAKTQPTPAKTLPTPVDSGGNSGENLSGGNQCDTPGTKCDYEGPACPVGCRADSSWCNEKFECANTCFSECISEETGKKVTTCEGGTYSLCGSCDSFGYVACWCTTSTTEYQIYACGSQPTGTPGNGQGNNGNGNGNGGSNPAPTPTPTPGTYPFTGGVYEDPDATTSGLGGTDNLCVGSNSSPVSGGGSTVSISRSGESKSKVLSGATYSISANTSSSDYTITLDLPFPPADPSNPLQCACNADATDPYRCIYTNQQPGNGVNFYVQYANADNTSWFQTLGGSSWAEINIESNIPTSTCTPPSCIPALIGSDPLGTLDSAGFPLTNTGSISTSTTGGTYIHEADSRDSNVQASGLGVDVPTENYNHFFNKLGSDATTITSSSKPTMSTTDLNVFFYDGDLTIDETDGWNIANNEQAVVLVDGSLTIDDTSGGDNRVVTVADDGTGFLMFVANNNITVTDSVGYNSITTNPAQTDIANLEGVYVADGILTISGQDGTTDRKFIGAGTFVGWSGVDLQRNFDDGSSPELNDDTAAEVFIFRPDLLYNTPRKVKSAQMTWREVSPSF